MEIVHKKPWAFFVGYIPDMNHKLYKAFICVSLVLALASTGVCAVVAPHTKHAPCDRSMPFDHGILAAPSGICALLPCAWKAKSPFLLTNSSSRQIENEPRQIFQWSSPAATGVTLSPLSDPSATTTAEKTPLSFYPPPPLYYRHCTIIR